MGLATDLGYEIGARSAIRRSIANLGATRPVSAVSNRVLRSMDDVALRMSGGNTTVTFWVTGIPPLWLTTTGARSGMARTVPLFGIPIDGDLGLLGTSFGQKATPAWVYNLAANPKATVAYRGASVDARARLARAPEAERIWDTAAGIYRGYANYASWAAHREIRVFVLGRDEPGS